MARKLPKRKPSKIAAQDPRAMLETLRSYDGVFASAKLTSGRTTIEVTFNERAPQSAQPGHKKAKAPKKTYIDSLSETPPPFEGWEQ